MIKKFLAALTLFFVMLINCAFAGQLKVTMLDVGQSESFLIETDAETILIDTVLNLPVL